MRTLVLNAGYEPLSVVSFRRALMLVLDNKATIVEIDLERPIWAVSESYDRPSVIALTRYVRIPSGRRVPVSRRGVLRRDGQRCAYCERSASTIDHVLPKSRGGSDTWDNMVACCLTCNNAKGDRTPSEMGWRLQTKPRMPGETAWFVRGVEQPAPQWSHYLAPAA
jgi:5-methylcytosine-specific restriction endonuclease McrA